MSTSSRTAQPIQDDPAPLIPGVDGLRAAAAVPVAGFGIWGAWSTRSWDIGPDAGTLIWLLLSLPPLLLLIPGLAWRWRWLTGVLPAALGLALVIGALSTGTHGGSELHIALDGSEVPSPVEQRPLGADLPVVTAVHVALSGLLLLTTALLLALEHKRQRRLILVACAALVVAVEVPHSIEEFLFRSEVAHVSTYVDGFEASSGRLPTREEFDTGYAPRRLGRLHYSAGVAGFHVHWGRALNRNHSLGYDSARRAFWGND